MAKRGFLARHDIVRNAIREDLLYFAIPAVFVLFAGMGVSALHLVRQQGGLYLLSIQNIVGLAFIAVAIASLFVISNFFASFLPWMVLVLPDSIPGLLTLLVEGEPLPDVWPIPIILMSVYSFLFVALAIWRFKREEF